MKMFLFSVHDSAVGAFLPVFFARSKGEAIRSFSQALDDPKHQFAQSRGDYALFQLGTFDDQNGEVSQAQGEPLRVISALEVGVPNDR